MTPAASWSPEDYHRAFNRCRDAWEATSPQLTITGWADMLDGLDEPQPSALRLVEPAGFTSGAEPRCAYRGSPPSAAPSATPNADGSAPNQHDGPGRMSLSDVRGRGQIGV